jgi:dihydrofolate synthase/folylpolyglutamate synthase
MAQGPLKPQSLESIIELLGAERRLNFGLDRFREALGRVGNPEQSVHTLLIAGTNGKGTTTLLVSGALAEAGFKVATYLSPHLQSVTERFLLNLNPIAEDQLLDLVVEFMPLAQEVGLSYFELLTLINFVRASREKVDLLVLEVGLGGRLDATNVTDPLACAITNIDLDHQEMLGDTREKILMEKLAILNKEGLLFTGEKDPALLAIMEKRCEELDTIYYYSKELKIERESVDWKGQRVRFNGYPFQLTNPSAGTVESAALAFLMLRIVFPKIPIAALQRSFNKTVNPGRFEIVQNHPRVILSGDHNLAGIECLEKTLSALPRSGRLLTVCGFSFDKPFREMYQRLAKISDQIVVTRTKLDSAPLPDGYQEMGTWVEDPEKALKAMLAMAEPGDTVLVTGSLYLVGTVRSIWRPAVVFTRPVPEVFARQELPKSAPKPTNAAVLH